MLARGPWRPDRVRTAWQAEEFQPSPSVEAAAGLPLPRRAGRPPGRLSGRRRLPEARAAAGPLGGPSALRARRPQPVGAVSGAGRRRILAGRAAGFLAGLLGRALTRELREEWSVEPERLRIEALVQHPSELVLLVVQAWLADGVSVTPDAEHDPFAWWPSDVRLWPRESDDPLRRIGSLVSVE